MNESVTRLFIEQPRLHRVYKKWGVAKKRKEINMLKSFPVAVLQSRIGREIQCLPYAVCFKTVQKIMQPLLIVMFLTFPYLQVQRLARVLYALLYSISSDLLTVSLHLPWQKRVNVPDE